MAPVIALRASTAAIASGRLAIDDHSFHRPGFRLHARGVDRIKIEVKKSRTYFSHRGMRPLSLHVAVLIWWEHEAAG
jgi:hypothetical protein